MHSLRPIIRKNYVLLLSLYLTILVFWGNHSTSLWDQDESSYAGYAKNMLETKEWLIPTYQWADVHRKPPLQFWLMAASMQIFGINEFSARLPISLAMLGLYALVFLWVRRRFGTWQGVMSAIVLSTTFLVSSLAKVAVLDGMVLLFSTVCALSVLEILNTEKRKYYVIFWVSFSLCVLTKGPPIIIFSSVYIGLLVLLHPNRKALIGLHPWFFLPCALAPLFIWGYMTTFVDDGKMVEWMIEWYIIRRINGNVFGQTGPPGTHFALLLLFFLPYLTFIPKALSKVFTSLRQRDNTLVLAVWFIAGWLPYEFSPSKLPAYVIVAHTPLAILIALAMRQHWQKLYAPNKLTLSLHFIFFGLLQLGIVVGAFVFISSTDIQVVASLGGCIVLVALVFSLKWVSHRYFSYTTVGVAILFQCVVWILLLPQINGLKSSTREVSLYLQKNAVANSNIIISNDSGKPPSLPFYISLYFGEVQEEYDFDKLVSKYAQNDAYAFVLNSTLLNKFLARHPELEYQEITSFFTDRKEKASYFIVINKAAKMYHTLERRVDLTTLNTPQRNSS